MLFKMLIFNAESKAVLKFRETIVETDRQIGRQTENSRQTENQVHRQIGPYGLAARET